MVVRLRKLLLSLLGVSVCGLCAWEAWAQDAPKVAPKASSKPQFSVDITENKDGDYGTGFGLASELGSQAVDLSLDWWSVDDGERFNMEWPKTANAVYPQMGVPVVLVLRPIDTVKTTLPDPLADKPLDHPEVIARFELLLEEIHKAMPDVEVPWVLIGNEIDGYLGTDAKKWSEFRAFYVRARAKVKALWGTDMPVSTISMWMSIREPEKKKQLLAMQKDMDFLAFNYYPLGAGFRVLPPMVASADLAAMTQFVPGKTVRIAEVGYPSSEKCGSSEAMQAEFYKNLFAAWGRVKGKVDYVHITWVNDLAPDVVEDLNGYYGVKGTDGEEAFAGFIGSLGLVKFGDELEKKPAFGVIREQRRRWGFRVELAPRSV